MAYRCEQNMSKECDGCGSCKPPETGVTIEATIKLRFTAYGEIESMMREGQNVKRKAEELVEDIIDCCGLAGQDMRIDDIEYELNE